MNNPLKRNQILGGLALLHVAYSLRYTFNGNCADT